MTVTVRRSDRWCHGGNFLIRVHSTLNRIRLDYRKQYVVCSEDTWYVGNIYFELIDTTGKIQNNDSSGGQGFSCDWQSEIQVLVYPGSFGVVSSSFRVLEMRSIGREYVRKTEV